MAGLRKILKYIILAGLAIFMLYPIFWMFISSFKVNEEIFKLGSILPKKWVFRNYIDGWFSISRHNFGEFFINSFFNSGMIVLGSVASCALAAYPLSRIKFRGRNILFGIILLTMMLPTQVLLIPRYMLFVKFGWTNSNLPLIVPSFFAQFSGAFFIYLMVQFMRSIPYSMDEAAVIDGCNHFQRFFCVILPNIKPALFTVAIFSFIWSWDDFLNQLIYLDSVEKFTVPQALRMFSDNSTRINWGEMFAMSILSLLPSTIIFAAAQKTFVEGIVTSGLKG